MPVLDIKQQSWGLGGSADTQNALHVYGDVVASNITSALQNLTQVETWITNLTNQITRGTEKTSSFKATASGWQYVNLTDTFTAGEIYAVGAGYTSGGVTGVRMATSNSTTAGNSNFGYCTASGSVGVLCPVARYHGTTGNSLYVIVRRGTAPNSSNNHFLRKLGSPH